jgi:hypothetical protein
MPTQTFLWIALPNGFDGSSLKFSAFVAPRLDPGHPDGSIGTLAEFTFKNWAKLMQSVSVSVLADGVANPIAATIDSTILSGGQPDPNLWDLFFPSTTPVRPFQFLDYSNGVEVVSFPVGTITGIIQGVTGGSVGITDPSGNVPIVCIASPGSTTTGGVPTEGGTPGSGTPRCDDDDDEHHHCGGDCGCDSGCHDCDDDCFRHCDGDCDHQHHCGKDGDHHHHHACCGRCGSCSGGSGSGGKGGNGGKGGSGGSGGSVSCTTLNPLESFISMIDGIEAALLQFAATPKAFSGESASSVLSRLGITLTPQQRAFFDFERFYNRYGFALPPNFTGGPVPGWTDSAINDVNAADFHRIVGLLGDYPFLLRKLGLVIDFTIPASALPSGTGGLTLVVTYPAPPPPAVTFNPTPKTMARVDHGTRWFRAADRGSGSPVVDGMLAFDDTTTYAISQGQVDGAAAKMIDMAVNEQRRVNPSLPVTVSNAGGVIQTVPARFAGFDICNSTPASAPIPALRSGVQLYQNDRITALEATFLRQAAFNTAMGNAILFSDDVMRGFRVDVRDRGNWRSLCARTGTVTISDLNGNNQAPVTLPTEEGYVKGTSGTKKDSAPQQLFVHESLFGWDGWSLVAPRPGATVADPSDKDYLHHTRANLSTNKLPLASRAPNPTTNPTVPQAFPFTITTDMHAAPNSLPRMRFGFNYRFRARVADLAGNSLRGSDVISDHATPTFTYYRFEPVLAPAIVPTAHFNPGESPEHIVVSSDNPVSTRWLVPPKASQSEVETHGMLDTLFDAKNFAEAFTISARESGTYLDMTNNDLLANAVIAAPDGSADQSIASIGVRGGKPPVRGSYVIYTGSQLPLVYLPDPLATGFALFVNADGTPTTRDYTGPSWHEIAPVRLELHAGTGTQQAVAAGSGTAPYRVTLPPATILEVNYSSTMPQSKLAFMAAWQQPHTGSFTDAQAATGYVNQIAPTRTFLLVHAVKKPLQASSLASINFAQQSSSDTFVTVTAAQVDAHSRSTGEVEVWAQWTEPQDLLPNAPKVGANAVTRRAFAFRTPVAYDQNTVPFPSTPLDTGVNTAICALATNAPTPRIDFGDTKYRVLQFQCTASTRYAEYYNPADVADPSQTTLVGDLTTFTATVLSTANGPLPDVAYVVPTFGWQDTSSTQHTRSGGGLRIYLNRPWFATGDGELLAVLVANVANGRIDPGDTVRPYISEMGFDPVYDDAFAVRVRRENTFTTLTTAHVVSADAQAGATKTLTPLELQGQLIPPTVVAVGHAVHFNSDRGLWYTDVELDIGNAYAPFVRLAVARYQPNSVDSTHLSKVVRIDCLQLASSRTATIVTGGGTVGVTVTGPSAPNLYGLNQNGAVPSAGHLLVATVDSRPSGSGELSWSPVQVAGADLSVTLALRVGSTTEVTTWVGTLANVPTGGGNDYRVRIEEFEQFQDDNGGATSRPVYLDTFSL